MNNFRDEVYNWSLNLVRDNRHFEGIFLLLSTWNFATFRYHMTTFDLKGFKERFQNCNFELFQKLSFENLNLEDRELQKAIEEIYEKLQSFKGIGSVGATKILHIMNPNCFLIWDTNIRNGYKCGKKPSSYLNFLRKIQSLFLKGKFKNLNQTVTIPRAIDLYNLKKYPTKMKKRKNSIGNR